MKKIIAFAIMIGMCLSLGTPSVAYAKKISKKALDIVPVAVDSVGNRTVVVTSDGTLWMWGSFTNPIVFQNNDGLDPGYRSSPVKMMKNVKSVSCSVDNTAVIKKDGSLWTWGNNNWGQVGNGGKNDGSFYEEIYQIAPTKIMNDVIMVSCGNAHMAAIKSDGTLWAWGDNKFGEISNGSSSRKKAVLTPVKVMKDVVYVSCGRAHTAAIKKDGSLWVWGANEVGQVGNGEHGVDQLDPVKIMDDVAMVDCGDGHTAAVKKDGSLWIWGENMNSCLGDGATYREEKSIDVPVKNMDNVSTVCCGQYITAAIKTDGTLWMWGDNDYYHIINDSSENVGTPIKVLDKCRCIALNGSSMTAFVLKENDDVLYGWGRKQYLGIGNDTREMQRKPVKVISDVASPDVPSATTRQEVNEAIDAKLVPKELQKNYGKPITRDGLEKLLTQLIKKVGGDVSAREILTDSDGTFNPKGKVTESRFVTVIKRTAKALGVKYKSFGLKRSKTKLTTERAIVMIYRAYKSLQ